MQLAMIIAAHAIAGFALMFVAHIAAFFGWNSGLPYWWAYLVLYPAAAVVSVRLKVLSPTLAALSLCFVPVLYFALLGIVDGDWHASHNALAGAVLACLVSFAVATVAGRIWPSTG